MKKEIFKATEQTDKIRKFLESKPEGAMVSFDEIESETGVVMNELNKERMRSALRINRQEYSPIVGIGIELSSPKNGNGIVGCKIQKVRRSANRAGKSANIIIEKHGKQMTKKELEAAIYKQMIANSVASALKQQKPVEKIKIANAVRSIE